MAASSLKGLDALGRPRQAYADGIALMDDVALFDECKRRIWLSEFSSSNLNSDHHWQVGACKDECERRDKPALFRQAREALKNSKA